MSEPPPEDDTPYIPPGTRVFRQDWPDGKREYGIVVHCWFSQEIQGYDCYVALFDGKFPNWQSDVRPGIFRYASASLNLIEPKE